MSCEAFIARLTSASGGHGSPSNSISTLIGPVKPPFAMMSSTRLKSIWPSPIAGKSQTRPSPRLSLRWTVDELRQRSRQIVHRLYAAVELDIGGVVVDQHVLAADPLEHRDRRRAGFGDLAVDLDAEADVARGGIVGKLMDIAHEGFFVFALAVMAADRGVHDVDAHALAEIERLEADRRGRPWW